MMPYMDGFSVLESLRSDDKQSLLPVVILTADVHGESKYRALRAGATDFLLKPLDLTEVLLRVRLIMERRKIEEELQRQKAKAEAASAAKDRFLAMASHELRVPLTPVLMWASAAAKEPDLRPDFQAGLKMVCRNVELEARMVDDMLDLSRITRGRLRLNMRSADAHDVVRHAAGIMRSTIEERHLALKMAFEACHHRVHADETRLHQVFWNLLGNACKFTPENGTIFIRTGNLEPGKIAIEITDSGIGLERESLTKIFDPFEQVDPKREGLGLGLAICKAIVEMHGGSISADSAGLGGGATFIVEFPTEESVA
jgi:signal transduction histidine kinase